MKRRETLGAAGIAMVAFGLAGAAAVDGMREAAGLMPLALVVAVGLGRLSRLLEQVEHLAADHAAARAHARDLLSHLEHAQIRLDTLGLSGQRTVWVSLSELRQLASLPVPEWVARQVAQRLEMHKRIGWLPLRGLHRDHARVWPIVLVVEQVAADVRPREATHQSRLFEERAPMLQGRVTNALQGWIAPPLTDEEREPCER